MNNGDDSGNPAVWERPWSTEAMRRQSPHWNLAGDAGLLQFLQDFSQRMISRTHEVEQMVNTLCHETKVINAKVSNTVNDFHALSNTQFVESRVYDEDIPEPVKDDKPPEKSKQERENEVVGKISDALNLGLSVMEEAFERVEIQQDSDSEDEDSPVHRQILLQPKDPYLQRPLPHLIGTKAFLDDDYVGIGEFSDEEDDGKASNENEGSSEEVSSEDESIPERKPPNLAQKLMRDEYESESISGGSDMFQENDLRDGDDDIFGDSSSVSSSEEDYGKGSMDQTDGVKKAPPPLLAEQLDAKIKQYTRKKAGKKTSRKNSDTQSIKSKQSIRSTAKTKAISEEDLFRTAAIPDDDEDDLFGKKGGLFSGTGRIFDQSQENSGLFDEVSKAENDEKLLTPRSRGYTKSGKKIPAGAVSVVGGDDIFSANPTAAAEPASAISNAKAEKVIPNIPVSEPNKKPATKKIPEKKQTGGLFDSDDNDDDLFTAPRKPSITSQTTKGNKSEPSIKSGNLFFSDDDDDENNLFGAPKNDTIKNVAKVDKKAPVGGVSVFGSLAGEIGTAIKSKRPKGDSDSEKSEDLSESRDTTSLKSQSSKKVISKDSRSNSVSSNSLFADDPDIDDLFTKKDETSKSTPSKTAATSSLFKDDLLESDEFDSLFVNSKPTIKSGSIHQSKTSSKTASLFTDIDEEDLFSIASKPASSSTAGLSVTEDDVKVPKYEPKKRDVEKELPKPIAPKISLFDDNPAEEDLFSVTSKLSQSPASMDSGKTPEEPKSPESSKISEPTKVRGTSLFDDDALFVHPNEESPEIDLFKSASSQSVKNEEKRQILATVSPYKKPIGGVALFGGVDLFGGSSSSLNTTTTPRSEEQKEDEPQSVTTDEQRQRPRAPLLKDTKEISVSFDDPVDISNTLTSAAKDRVKVQTKRRPPSRKGRQAAASKSGIDVVTEAKVNEETTKSNLGPESSSSSPRPATKPEIPEAKEKSASPFKNIGVSANAAPFLAVTADFRSPSTEEEDLFSVMDPPDKGLLSNTREKLKKPPSKPVLEEPKPSDEIDGDLFGTTKEGVTNPEVSVEDPVTLAPPPEQVKPQDLFKKCNKQLPIKNQSLFGDDEDDDIFSVSTSSNSVSKTSAAKVSKDTLDNSASKKSTVKDLFSDEADVDDIFKSVPSSNKDNTKKLPPKMASMSKSIFDDDTDDDSDIFAPKPKVSGTSSTKSKSTSQSKTKQMSSGGSGSGIGKRKESLVKKTVKHSTDVFDDPLLGGGGQSDKD